ncbi:MAG: pyrroloquinoline quinone biosynthesis peptide chaperone PqqD [Methylotenera sp.]|nr:pyrroloquinoline quinone biosynthesis peptide chaperone PqqD [Methylotenera sp.]MDO9232370.1 pyrroloquinoline quinone biosynthesis peptide chaperone PqqD [Methylotenera sp.]MDO9389021.1 pyrroloquinoline quinone biosynthesis peptide chaperone PqqD [Methylotenera sp.]MDP1597214.1 pyrroloquinoline quinone biosynthesis peptide chaperone PqqD [Methylotenera sp.]MDP1755009.1 pyrroloquinoline quinone biosynthesis peptide chaperone PqqD [Methylotenera sp.]
MENPIQHTDIYALSHHHRFQWEEAQQSYVILFPEGMVKLHGGAGEVLKRLDGKVNVGEIVADLKVAFPDADEIESDIIGMFELGVSKGWLRKV